MRIGLVRVALIVLAVGFVAIACGSQSVDTTATPGITDEDRSIDRSPFEMAGPKDQSGSTTIPGVGPTLVVPTSIDPSTGETAVLGQLPPSEGGPDPFTAQPPGGPSTPFTLPKPTTTTTIPPPPTTTTTTTTIPLPTQIEVPDVATITGICGLYRVVTSLRLVLVSEDLDLRDLTAGINAAMNRYSELAPPEVASAVGIVFDGMRRILDTLASNGHDLQHPAVQAIIGQAVDHRPPFEAFEFSNQLLRNYERQHCAIAPP